jgi:26S proteasome regulatory subunit N2
MKFDESSPSPKHGDISPINGSISNLADDGKASTSASKPPRKSEPSFELLPNFSRVTPAQLAYITFPNEGRYQPVRAVSSAQATNTNTNATAPGSVAAGKAPAPPAPASLGKLAGGGGILILADLRPEEEGEFIEFGPVVGAPDAEDGTGASASEHVGNGHAVRAPPPPGPHIALDESTPDVDPPEPFEVC